MSDLTPPAPGVVAVEDDHDAPRNEALAFLSERERFALNIFEKTNTPPIASSTAERLFLLFLRGLTCDEISKLNPGFTLGQVVDARVRWLWDRHRREYDARLMTDGADAIKRAQFEAALLAADMLAASAKLNRERLHRFMVTGDERDLGDLSIGSLRALKETVEVLLRATRQDAPAPRGAPPAEGPGVVPVGHAPQGGVLELAAAKRASRKG